MNLKKLMKVKNSRGQKYVKDDSLDDFSPSSSLKGFNEGEGWLYVSGCTDAKEKELHTALGNQMATLVYFESGAGLNTTNYFCIKVLNNEDNAYDLIDALKSIGTWAIHYAIDKMPNMYSPQVSNTSWQSKSADDIIKIISGEMKDPSKF